MKLHQIKKISAYQKKQLTEQRDTLQKGENLCQLSPNRKLISRVYKELKILDIKAINNPVNK
jgi:hypothetical protein